MLLTTTSTNGVLFNNINIDDLEPSTKGFSDFFRFSAAKKDELRRNGWR